MRPHLLLFFLLLMLTITASSGSAADAQPGLDPENTLYLDLDHGRVVIRMHPDWAPKTVARLKHLARGGFYDGLAFHRVINGFVAQTGDPAGKGSDGSGRPLAPELTHTPQVRGVVSMAHAPGKAGADSQWFIVLADNRAALDAKYTAWGEVVSGMELVDQIKKGDAKRDGKVNTPDAIVRLQVAADADAPAGSHPAVQLLADPRAAAEARDFSAMEMRCGVLNGRPGSALLVAVAQIWAHGYMAGSYKAQGKLAFSRNEVPVDNALSEACKVTPNDFLLVAANQQVAKMPHGLPASTPAFAVVQPTCKEYLAARDGADAAKADFMDLWAIGYIEGYQYVGQPGMEIPFAARTQLLTAVVGSCTRNADMGFADLVGVVAAKVRLR